MTPRCAICREPLSPLSTAYQLMPVEVFEQSTYPRLDSPLLLCAGCTGSDVVEDFLRHRCPITHKHHDFHRESGGLGRCDWLQCRDCGCETSLDGWMS